VTAQEALMSANQCWNRRTQHNCRHFYEFIPTLLIGRSNILRRSATRWHVFDMRETFGEQLLMSKRTSDSGSKNSPPEIAEPAPPPLSEKLIAQLQGAVSAAQRKRNPEPVALNPKAAKQS